MALTITSIVPATQRLGESVTVTMKGIDFTSPLQVFVEALQPVEASKINVKSSTLITAIIPGVLARGFFGIRVRLDSGTEVTLENSFAVVPTVPSPPFAGQTFKVIMNRLLQRLPARYDITEGSTIWDLLAPVAIESEFLYVQLEEFLKLVFLPDSSGTYLDLLGLEHDVPRKLAVKAIGSVKFTGTSAALVTTGFRISNTVPLGNQPIVFVTDADVTLVDVGGGIFEGTVNITAEEVGVTGNLVIAAIDTLLDAVSGVNSVTNAATTTGGGDEEGDGTYKGRILRRISEPSHGGNIGDYIKWAQDVDGVGKVGVEPLFSGNGTVRVLITDTEGNPANAALITKVQNVIDPTPASNGKGNAPIGATVTIAAPITQAIDVSVTLVLEEGAVASEVQTAVKDNLKVFINGLDIGEDVRYFGIAEIILNTVGVDSLNTLTIAEPPTGAVTVDIIIVANEKAVDGTHTVS